MLENAVYSVITVEGCADILWKDGKSPEMREKAAAALHITAQDLLELRVDRRDRARAAGRRAGGPGVTAAKALQQALRPQPRRSSPPQARQARPPPPREYFRMGQFSDDE